MAKLSVTFDQFSAALPSGFKPVEKSPTIFFTSTGKAGKVEINCNSGTFTVGSGSGKRLEQVTQAVVSAGFKVKSRTKGWTVLEFTSVADVTRLVETAAAAAPSTVAKAKAPKAKVSAVEKLLGKVQTSKTKSLEEIKAIRAKNLETMRKVSGVSETIAKVVKESRKRDDEDTYTDPDAFRAEFGLPKRQMSAAE